MKKSLAVFSAFMLCVGEVHAANRYTAEQLVSLALSGKRGDAARDSVDAARAALESVSSHPNPEIELLEGRARSKAGDGLNGRARSYSITQRLDYPWQRSLRIEAASGAVEAAKATERLFRSNLEAQIRRGFVELLRREAELSTIAEDVRLLRQIRDGVALKVELGEAARYELIKAEAELLNAQKAEQSAVTRVDQGRALLRGQVGIGLPREFALESDLNHDPVVPPLSVLQKTLVERNPELMQRRLERSRAELLVNYEKSLRAPQLAVKAALDEDPALSAVKVGVVMTLPIWDRRSGQIAEARALAARAGDELEARQFELAQELEYAYRQYEIAANQVQALSSGIVKQAESALKAAQAAYRYGERGILDYLDAQRVYRAARNDLIAARADLQQAAIEIDRIAAKQLNEGEKK